jgi:hypothetical protein
MFGIEWSDPQTFWLNLTNIGLGIVTLACVGFIVVAILRDVTAPAREKVHATGPLLDTHAFRVPELGMTMADGGEPLRRKTEQKKDRRKK